MTDQRRLLILNDRDFWDRLEWAACKYLDDTVNRTRGVCYAWIDGFLPESATNTRRGLDVCGTAWVDNGVGQVPYRFVASVPQKLLGKAARDWRVESLELDRDQARLHVVIG